MSLIHDMYSIEWITVSAKSRLRSGACNISFFFNPAYFPLFHSYQIASPAGVQLDSDLCTLIPFQLGQNFLHENYNTQYSDVMGHCIPTTDKDCKTNLFQNYKRIVVDPTPDSNLSSSSVSSHGIGHRHIDLKDPFLP